MKIKKQLSLIRKCAREAGLQEIAHDKQYPHEQFYNVTFASSRTSRVVVKVFYAIGTVQLRGGGTNISQSNATIKQLSQLMLDPRTLHTSANNGGSTHTALRFEVGDLVQIKGLLTSTSTSTWKNGRIIKLWDEGAPYIIEVEGIQYRLNNDSSSILRARPRSSHSSSLKTEEHTVLSADHGRQRRQERDISKRDLQLALKYGKQERAMDDRRGRPRYRFTYRGVVYLTDQTMKHEITSWRTQDAEEAHEQLQREARKQDARSLKSHTILVVDHSASMRKNDVPNYLSRTAAVYESLVNDLLRPQLKGTKLGDGSNLYSLVEMSDDAHVVFERQQLDQNLVNVMHDRKNLRARSHGNYIPALQKVTQLLLPELYADTQILIIFLSDGAPSDHQFQNCEHGGNPWAKDNQNRFISQRYCGSQHQACLCRNKVRSGMKDECIELVKAVGARYGQDRVRMCTVAFGPANEKFTVLKEMAEAVPKHSFQKLGISSINLRTAFSDLSSTLTTLRTDVTASSGGNRKLVKVDRMKRMDVIDVNDIGWDQYHQTVKRGRKLVKKERWSATKNSWIPVELSKRTMVLHAHKAFGEGAERNVFYFFEGQKSDEKGEAIRLTSNPLVAKQSKYEHSFTDPDFHKPHAKALAEVSEFSNIFNRQLGLSEQYHVSCVDCFRYVLLDETLSSSILYILVEPKLDGKFTKWNNNAGHVRKVNKKETKNEDVSDYSGEDEEDEEDDAFGDGAGALSSFETEDIPQAFSHYTFVKSNKTKLICDIQGVWNKVDGFILTDPVVHTKAKRSMGATDKGSEGMRKFFVSHVCGKLCRRLGLSPVSASSFGNL